MIKVSLVYEWMAMVITFMIRVGMVSSKSASDQMRFTKVIYANSLVRQKQLFEAMDTVLNSITIGSKRDH